MNRQSIVTSPRLGIALYSLEPADSVIVLLITQAPD